MIYSIFSNEVIGACICAVFKGNHSLFKKKVNTDSEQVLWKKAKKNAFIEESLINLVAIASLWITETNF